ncbi:MAG: molybdopterin cofactor-binding domain-containing protein, partial [Thermomicrobiales bacterium]
MVAETPSIIGASVARPDAIAKLDGSAIYPADAIRAEMLHARIVFAHLSRATLVAIDTTAALAVPGVVEILTAEDVPYNRFGLVEADQPVLCEIGDETRFVGDKVAVIIADSPDAAERGVAALAVTLRPLPPVIDPELALDTGSPLVHSDRPSNLMLHVPIRRGDVDAALAGADVVIEGEFSTGWQEHAFLQPEAGVAWVDEDGRVVIKTAGQWLYEDRRQIASVLG